MITCGRDFIRKGKGKTAEEFAFSRKADIWGDGKHPFNCHAKSVLRYRIL